MDVGFCYLGCCSFASASIVQRNKDTPVALVTLCWQRMDVGVHFAYNCLQTYNHS